MKEKTCCIYMRDVIFHFPVKSYIKIEFLTFKKLFLPYGYGNKYFF